jgi:hypothetical protein
MAWQKLKRMLGKTINKKGWAKAENTSGDRMLTGGLRPPFTTLCGHLWQSHHVVIHYVVSACIFSLRPAMFFQLLDQAMTFLFVLSHACSLFVQLVFLPACKIVF